ncbi:diacylglycerol/lipid kinase family protein [Bacteroidota bacterium]
MKKILFIINPIRSKKLKKPIEDYLTDSHNFTEKDYDIEYSEYASHSYDIASDNINNYDIFIAAGGDGTVNEVSRAIVGTKKILGIVPIGSGNGLAKHLKITAKIPECLKLIKAEKTKIIDSALINNRHFINLSGTGFDAYIAHNFSESKSRGFKKYIIETIKALFKYKSKDYKINVDGAELNVKALFLSFANSNQFGNNAIINPESVIDDGKLELVICKKFPFYAAPFLAWRLFNKTIHRSKYIEIMSFTELLLYNKEELIAHLDGEPVVFTDDIRISIVPDSIHVIV